MKKRRFISFFIFTMFILGFLISDVAFGQSSKLINDPTYKRTLLREDVRSLLPDFLKTFKKSGKTLAPPHIDVLLGKPIFLRTFVPGTDNQFIGLLYLDKDFRALFGVDEFYRVLKSSDEIDKLLKWYEEQGEPLTLEIVSGNEQSGETGKPLAQPFVVGVLDQKKKPRQGIAVTFTVTAGNGQLSDHTIHTDVYGQARTTLTLGSDPGTYQVKASVAAKDSLNGVELTQTFTATAIDDGTTKFTLDKFSGDSQKGKLQTALGNPLVVLVKDQEGNARSGVDVTFRVIRGGRLSRTTAQTDNAGRAETTLTLGSEPGIYQVEASVVGFPALTQTFTATTIDDGGSTLPPMYWIGDTIIHYRLPGGREKTFDPPKDEATLTGGLAVDTAVDTVGRKVYWTEEKGDGTGRIQSADLDGNNVETVKDIFAVPSNIAVGTDKSGQRWIYWTNSRKKIQRINVDGSGFQGDFMEFPTPPNHIAFDEGEHVLYWTEKGRIRGVAANGKGKREPIVENLGGLGGIAVADGTVYWTEQTNGLGKVMSINRNGSDSKSLLAVTESILSGIAVDAVGQKVYWKTADEEIQSVPFTGAIQTVDTSKIGGAESSADAIALGGTASEPAIQGAPSLSPAVSVENTLLANYPNPFNPETWIPYQLSEVADVSVSIYAVDGRLVRRLDLGHQSAGVYQSRSRAAYWDGRNAFGERVASGLYFYTLTAGDFTATRKMLIRK